MEEIIKANMKVFDLLDVLVRGELRGGLLTVTGKPGSGKTGFLNHTALAMLHRRLKSRVHYFSLENEKEEVHQMVNKKGVCPAIPERLCVVDRNDLSVTDIRNRLEQDGTSDLVLIDYLQLLSPLAGIERDNRSAVNIANTLALKTLAAELNVPVMIASMQSLKSEDVTMSSGPAIEHADYIIGMVNEKQIQVPDVLPVV